MMGTPRPVTDVIPMESLKKTSLEESWYVPARKDTATLREANDLARSTSESVRLRP